MKCVLLAGGSGTRLFPLSRSGYPKQFLKLNSERSLLHQATERLISLVGPDNVVIVTNENNRHHVWSDIQGSEIPAENILCEPIGRNTAPAIALAIAFCRSVLKSDDDEVLLVTPADHLLAPHAAFAAGVEQAEKTAHDGYIVTFGIKPDKPETGYGYIRMGQHLETGYRVAAFKEKPDEQTARQYLETGNYLWNSGMFAFTIGVMEQELLHYCPEVGALVTLPLQEIGPRFADVPSISIDYAVAEKSSRMAVVPLDLQWNDIGSWEAIYDCLPKDQSGNVLTGDVMTMDCENSMIFAHDRLVTAIGLNDVIVVETDDVVMVANKGESQKVKALVGQLHQQGRKEVEEHTTTYRPWGSYTVLEATHGYKIKRLVVNPGQSLSLQMHYHRSEHWVVVRGTAKVTIADEIRYIHESESVYIPKTMRHRLENPGVIALEIIEVQNGTYLGEDDIVRFDDVYGRKG